MQCTRSELQAIALRRAESESQREAVTLLTWILAVVMVAIVMAIRLGAWLLAPSETPIPPERLSVHDRPLLTPQQREEARRSGVGAYEFDGVWIVNAALPPEYWENWIG